MSDSDYIDVSNWQNGAAGKIYLIPAPLAEGDWQQVLPQGVKNVCTSTSYYLAENIRTARRYLSKLKLGRPIEELVFEEVNKHTSFEQIVELLQPVLEGQDAGVLSEAGSPGVADPGAEVVEAAHQLGIEVVPLAGPSSFLLALMASGLNGQQFSFHGYLPIEKQQRSKKIKALDQQARSGHTQLFMETPYRNDKLLQDLLRLCHPDTRLCIARDLTGSKQYIKTKSISAWKKQQPALHKIPVVFLLG